MFKRKKHEIENLNAKIKNRDEKIDSLVYEKNKYKEENKALRFEVAEYRETLKEIEKILTSNMYNNEKVALRKIKELATITTMY